MRTFVSRFVRSLLEREDHPEHTTDLGTLVCWILEHHGFDILQYPYKYEGVELRVSKGRLQHGIDILAVKRDKRSVHSYRFVLKQGDMRSWPSGSPGTMPYDLFTAGALPASHYEASYGVTPDSTTLVAVHNGDRDTEKIGVLIEADLERIRERSGCKTDWWDAEKLTTMVLEVAQDGAPSGPSTTLFAPRIQPFVRLALDSLHPERGASGAGFDYAAIDSLLMPIREAETTTRLTRRVDELALFVTLLHVETDRVASGNLLPVLETIERILCAAMAKAVDLSAKLPAPLRRAFQALLKTYEIVTEKLRAKLHTVAQHPAGLALPSRSEPVDYPSRVLRLSAYLAVAGIRMAQRGRPVSARRMAKTLALLWRNNASAAHTPLTDDHLIEVLLVLELWTAVGRHKLVRRTCAEILERLAARRELGLPLPAVRIRFTCPMPHPAIAALVGAHRMLRQDREAFDDTASTLAPALLYLNDRLGGSFAPARRTRLLEGPPALSLQVWQPPMDAGSRWYTHAIEHEGNAFIMMRSAAFSTPFVDEFEAAAEAIDVSMAERNKLAVIDRMAWKQTRTPPSMHFVVTLAGQHITP